MYVYMCVTHLIGTSPVVDSNAQFIEALNTVKCKEQNDLLKFRTSSDPFEMEFNRVVQPVMNTCSKEAIAVSHQLNGQNGLNS